MKKLLALLLSVSLMLCGLILPAAAEGDTLPHRGLSQRSRVLQPRCCHGRPHPDGAGERALRGPLDLL